MIQILQKLEYYIDKVAEYIPKDKLIHFFVGFFIFVIANYFTSQIIALLIVIIWGVGKELLDKYVKKTKFDVVDLLFTISAGLILTIL